MSNIKILYADEDKLYFVYKSIEDKLHILVNVVLTPRPDTKPDKGIMELNKISILKLDPEVEQTVVLNNVSEHLSGNGDWITFARNCIDFDSVSDDSYVEHHLYIITDKVTQSEAEAIVGILDELNAEGLHSIGSFTYDTEFQKLFYMDE